MKPQPLGDLELEVMKVVWGRGEVAVADVLGALHGGRKLHYNTVMTVMSRLARKGWLEHRVGEGRAYRYRARVSRERASRTYLQAVTERFFDGSLSGAVAAFLGGTRPDASEISKLRALLDRVEAGGR